MKKKGDIIPFIALLRAGLWEQEARLANLGVIDYEAIYKLAEEQSVIGIVTAGLEHISDTVPPQKDVLQFVGTTLQYEQRNIEMNSFVERLMVRLKKNNVFCLLVKGQGVAQYYERPLWRASGDVDLLMDDDNYSKSKPTLFPIADDIQNENLKTKHQGLSIKGFDVELHGNMPFLLSTHVDGVINNVLLDSLKNGGVGLWCNGKTDVYLPNPDNHIFLVFTHFLHHFFVEGVGLRQICDWCRLLWAHKDVINLNLLEKRLKESGLLTEWKAFAALAVENLGMSNDTMPFYENGYSKRAERILCCILKNGNMGHNNDISYRYKYPKIVVKIITFIRRLCDFMKFAFIFPIDSPKFFVTYFLKRVV